MYCQICNIEIEVSQQSFHRNHLKKLHSLSSKDYYDKYIKLEREDICNCGKIKQYISFNEGYTKSCSQKCSSNSQEVKNKIKETKLSIYRTTNNYDKIKETVSNKYRVDNVSQLEHIKQKKKETYIKNYGVENYALSYENREKRELGCKWIPKELLREFELYHREVLSITKKNKKRLFELWDGLCYYTKIKLHKGKDWNAQNYPTIDHKKSIFNSFKDKINPNIVGSIENLCICSREMNIKKGTKNYEEFIKELC